jgi:hypothetical protein
MTPRTIAPRRRGQNRRQPSSTDRSDPLPADTPAITPGTVRTFDAGVAALAEGRDVELLAI